MTWLRKHWLSTVAIITALVVFVVPFIFIIFMAAKDKKQASLLDFSFPEAFHAWENFIEVIQVQGWRMHVSLQQCMFCVMWCTTALACGKIQYRLQARVLVM